MEGGYRPERPEPKIIGSVTDERRAEIIEDYARRFGEAHWETLDESFKRALLDVEREKQPFERGAIRMANEISNRILDALGLDPFDVREDNVHIVTGPLQRFPYVGAIMSYDDQAAYVFANQFEDAMASLEEASAIFHETCHLKGYLGIEVKEDGHRPYRGGFGIVNWRRENQAARLLGLEEAVVSELERRHYNEIIEGISDLKENHAWQMSEEATALKRELARAEERDPSEMMWISKDGARAGWFSYPEQRKVLSYIIDILSEDNASRFNSRDAIFDEFVRARFTGQLLPLARLIESSFGRGSFRRIGRMSGVPESAHSTLAELTRRREDVRMEGTPGSGSARKKAA